jgi:uncharacterized protein (DUF2237 family)
LEAAGSYNGRSQGIRTSVVASTVGFGDSFAARGTSVSLDRVAFEAGALTAGDWWTFVCSGRFTDAPEETTGLAGDLEPDPA